MYRKRNEIVNCVSTDIHKGDRLKEDTKREQRHKEDLNKEFKYNKKIKKFDKSKFSEDKIDKNRSETSKYGTSHDKCKYINHRIGNKMEFTNRNISRRFVLF